MSHLTEAAEETLTEKAGHSHKRGYTLSQKRMDTLTEEDEHSQKRMDTLTEEAGHSHRRG